MFRLVLSERAFSSSVLRSQSFFFATTRSIWLWIFFYLKHTCKHSVRASKNSLPKNLPNSVWIIVLNSFRVKTCIFGSKYLKMNDVIKNTHQLVKQENLYIRFVIKSSQKLFKIQNAIIIYDIEVINYIQKTVLTDLSGD